MDFTSTTSRSLDLESLLGMGQSVSDSETDAQGLKHIKNQLEGLENMYSEVLKMLNTRKPHLNEFAVKSQLKKKFGSVSSLPSSSVSNKPLREKKRLDERKKLKDLKVSFNVSEWVLPQLHTFFCIQIFKHLN